MARRLLSCAQIRRVLDQPDRTTPRGWRDRAIMRLMAVHRLRPSQIVALQVAHVDLESGVLRVGARAVRLAPDTVAALNAWLRARQLHGLGEEARSLFLALDRPGRAGLTTRAVRHLVGVYIEQAGYAREGIVPTSIGNPEFPYVY